MGMQTALRYLKLPKAVPAAFLPDAVIRILTIAIHKRVMTMAGYVHAVSSRRLIAKVSDKPRETSQGIHFLILLCRSWKRATRQLNMARTVHGDRTFLYILTPASEHHAMGQKRTRQNTEKRRARPLYIFRAASKNMMQEMQMNRPSRVP